MRSPNEEVWLDTAQRGAVAINRILWTGYVAGPTVVFAVTAPPP